MLNKKVNACLEVNRKLCKGGIHSISTHIGIVTKFKEMGETPREIESRSQIQHQRTPAFKY